MEADLQRYVEDREEILARLKRVVIETLLVRREPEEIDPDTPLFGTGLGLDSVDAVELVVAIEEEFGIDMPTQDAPDPTWLRTMNTLADLVLATRSGEAND